MTSIKLDKNCDIVFNDEGVCELVEGNEDIAQAIRTELEQNKGQWLLNTLYGTPYLNEENTGILQSKANVTQIINEIKKVILKYPVEVVSIDYIDNRLIADIKINNEVVRL